MSDIPHVGRDLQSAWKSRPPEWPSTRNGTVIQEMADYVWKNSDPLQADNGAPFSADSKRNGSLRICSKPVLWTVPVFPPVLGREISPQHQTSTSLSGLVREKRPTPPLPSARLRPPTSTPKAACKTWPNGQVSGFKSFCPCQSAVDVGVCGACFLAIFWQMFGERAVGLLPSPLPYHHQSIGGFVSGGIRSQKIRLVQHQKRINQKLNPSVIPHFVPCQQQYCPYPLLHPLFLLQ